MTEKLNSRPYVSLLAVTGAFLTATLLLLAIGRNPAGMYEAIVQAISGLHKNRNNEWVFNLRYAGVSLANAVPLMLCGLSMGFAARTGLFNIGAEGQFIAGLSAAQFIAVFFPPIPVLHVTLAIAGAMAAGAAWGAIAGFLKARYKVSEVVSTIMLNYIAFYLHRIFTMMIPGSNTYRTQNYPASASLVSPALASITNNSQLNHSLWLALAALIVYWAIIEKTTLGFSLRAVGLNKDAAFAGGINVKACIAVSMAIAGAFAGLAGASVALGIFPYGRILQGMEGYGFNGIAVALAGNSNALGIMLSGLLFGILKSAQPLMQNHQIPKEITSIILGLIVVFISLRAGLKLFFEWRRKKLSLK